MSRLIDAVRKSALPSNMMHFAARGALMVPPEEMIEILVHLANHNTVFGPQAKMTLAGWNVKSCREILANPASPKEVLEYFIDPNNLQPDLLPALLENPSLGEDLLVRLARSATREQAEILLENPRVGQLRSVLESLTANQNLPSVLTTRVKEKLALAAAPAPQGNVTAAPSSSSVGKTVAPPPASPQAETPTATSSRTPAHDPFEVRPAGIDRLLAEPVGEIPAPSENVLTPVENPAQPAPPGVQSAPLPPSVQSSSVPSSVQSSPVPSSVQSSPVQDSERAPRLIDSVRKSALPSNMMQFAARGALMVPPEEMIEILVHLANHNTVFGPQAKMTLAGWNVPSSREVLANPASPREVLEYFMAPANVRPALLPDLLENPSVGEDLLVRLAQSATREQAEILLESSRVSHLRSVLEMLTGNPNLPSALTTRVKEKLSLSTTPAPAGEKVAPLSPSPEAESPTVTPAEAPGHDAVISEEEVVDRFMAEHAREIAADADKKFAPVEDSIELPLSQAVTPAAQAAAASAGGEQKKTGTQTAGPPKQKKWILSAEEQRGSALQKIAKLDTKGRILLAMKGNKEERSLLIRDGTKIVALAVLESPRITDAEVERYSSQKNISDAVLRAISMKRSFIKQYPIVKNLTFNPRTPIDVALGLMKNLLTPDLRHLSGNKEVSDTVRKLATKMFRQKLATTKS
jgi:hypothetical protein